MRWVSGYQRARAAAFRSRKAPDRSITRTPASTSEGPSSAAAESGSARNTTSASCASVSADSGVIWPSQMRASAGSGRAAPDAEPDDIAAVTDTAGWRAEQPQQLLAGIAGRAGDGDASGGRRRRHRRLVAPPRPSVSCRSGRCENCMHQKEYLYTHVLEEAIKIDV